MADMTAHHSFLSPFQFHSIPLIFLSKELRRGAAVEASKRVKVGPLLVCCLRRRLIWPYRKASPASSAISAAAAAGRLQACKAYFHGNLNVRTHQLVPAETRDEGQSHVQCGPTRSRSLKDGVSCLFSPVNRTLGRCVYSRNRLGLSCSVQPGLSSSCSLNLRRREAFPKLAT